MAKELEKQRLARLHSGEAHTDDHRRHESGQGGLGEAELGSYGALLLWSFLKGVGLEGVCTTAWKRGEGHVSTA